ncbi:MAG: benzoate-CoA ligase family protein [Oscillatoriophycideae cyanobacterium NC_groundwater_1537_Pr4_S-0.65um_50_18]|nr:benzoate-CoA ligase family protein [Oscillatoriophycideae cyanobacterium NC_groundwater_1537_Pr4_S-0.65um_50_18]
MDSISAQLPSIFNVAAYFLADNQCLQRRDKIAFYYRNESYTYAQVNGWVQRMAGLLTKLGLERENRIAILLPDSPEFVFAFWGAIWLGSVPVPINAASTLDDIRYMLQDCRAKVLLTNQAWFETLSPLTSPFLQHIVQVDGEKPVMSLLAEQDDSIPWATTHREEAAFWLYTSGSTGRPKGVIHLHQSMVICAERYGRETLGLREDDILYSVAKMPFAYGLGNTLYMPMAVGAASILSDAVNAFDIISDIQNYQPTVLFGIPSMYASMLSVQEIAPLHTASLRLCLSAAEQLPKTIWFKWRETYGIEICEGIGTTELLHVFLANLPGECRPGSSGRPVSGYDVQVVDEQGIPTQPGEMGALQVRGESLMLGYWNRLQETRNALLGTTMRTGDRYIRDEDGYFWFMGRDDDFFKVNGQWISPFEIEDVLLQHEGVLDAAVVPRSQRGEDLTQVVAYVSLKPGFTPSAEFEKSIRQVAKAQLPHFKAPTHLYFLESLPRTPTGKIHRKAFLNQH